MNIETTKLELMQLLLQTQKESVLKKIRSIFEEELDWWEEMSEEEKQQIETGIKQLDKGENLEHNKVMQHFDRSKWKSFGPP